MDINNEAVLCATVVSSWMTMVICADKISKKKKRKSVRRNWLNKRVNRGVLNMLDGELRMQDPVSYKNFLRMESYQFEFLLNALETDIAKQDSIMQYTISPRNRLEVTLRFMATGETYRSLMYQTRIHESTISRIVPEVCSAIIKHLRTNLKTPCTVDEWRNIANDFNALWNFPHCLGALDGKHVKFRAPISDGSYYYNYKGEHSIVLLAMSDAHYRFIYFNLGINGRVSDGGVYQACYLPRAIEKNELNFPNPEALPGRNSKVPYVIVADDAFPLSKHMLKPYAQRGLDHDSLIFNYRLSRARRIIENAFGILCNRFRILLNPINLSAAKVEIVTLACIALHNYLLKDVIVHPEAVPEPLPTNLTKVGIQGGNKSSFEARNIRDEFKEYFNSDQGKVDWQENSIERNNL